MSTAALTIGSYGGGTNSEAMYIGMVERGEPPPHAILMADTGGEHPHTYFNALLFSLWLELHGYPDITVVKKGGRQETLEENCVRLSMLPAIAYGYKKCSQKFKIEPQEKWANNNPKCRLTWELGGKVTKLIGYDWDELGRARFYDDPKYEWRYPLIEWKWGRENCKEAITRAGLRQPGKSSCFFCPHMKKPEILALRERYPELLDRALKMEAGAKLTKIKGLGRSFAWRDFIAGQPVESNEAEKEPICGCYDG